MLMQQIQVGLQNLFEPAEYTAFLHGDPLNHWSHFQWGYFNLLLRSMSIGRLDVGFLHLSAPRLVAVRNPCQDQVYQYVLGRPRGEELLYTYCCAQFLVHRDRLLGKEVPALNPNANYMPPDLVVGNNKHAAEALRHSTGITQEVKDKLSALEGTGADLMHLQPNGRVIEVGKSDKTDSGASLGKTEAGLELEKTEPLIFDKAVHLWEKARNKADKLSAEMSGGQNEMYMLNPDGTFANATEVDPSNLNYNKGPMPKSFFNSDMFAIFKNDYNKILNSSILTKIARRLLDPDVNKDVSGARDNPRLLADLRENTSMQNLTKFSDRWEDLNGLWVDMPHVQRVLRESQGHPDTVIRAGPMVFYSLAYSFYTNDERNVTLHSKPVC